MSDLAPLSRRISFLAAAGLLAAASLAHSQTIWTGGGGADQNWTNVANWRLQGGGTATVPTVGTNVIFEGNNTTPAGATPSGVTSVVGTPSTATNTTVTIGSLRFRNTYNTPPATEPPTPPDVMQHTISIGTGDTLSLTGSGALKVGAGTGGTGEPRVNGVETLVSFVGGGALNINNAADGVVEIGLRNADQNQAQNITVFDVRQLGSFTANVNIFRVGYESRNAATFWMSNGTNTITSNLITVGNSEGNNAALATHGVKMYLGAGTNNLYTSTLDIGRGKSLLSILGFEAGSTSGSVVIRGKTAGTTANINVGVNTEADTSAPTSGTLDLWGHQATVSAGNLVVAYRNRNGAGGAEGKVRFNQGTFTVENLTLAHRAMTVNSPAVNGIIEIGGGTFTVNNSFVMATNTGSGSGITTGTVRVTGGTLVSNVDILKGGGVDTTAILAMNGSAATIDLTGHSIGTATNHVTLQLAAGTLKNVKEINGGQTGLIKDMGHGTGTLILDGAITYTGGTSVRLGSGGIQVGTGGTSGALGSGAISNSGLISFNRSNLMVVSDTVTGRGGDSSTVGFDQIGMGRTVMSGNNIGYQEANFRAKAGVLQIAHVNGFGGGGGALVEVSNGAELRFATDTVGSTATVYGMLVESGGAVGVQLGHTINVMSGGEISVAGNVDLKVYGNGSLGGAYGSSYTLLSSAIGGLSGANYRLMLYNNTDFTATLNPVTAGQVSVSVTAASAMTTAYWKGGLGVGDNVWALSDGTASNWTTTPGGTVVAVTPGATTDVHITADSPTQQTNMTLGADMTIKSLTVDNAGAIAVNDLRHTLTINDGAGAIRVLDGTGEVTFNANLTLANAAAEISVAGTRVASISADAVLNGNFHKTGTGTLRLFGTIYTPYGGTLAVDQGVLETQRLLTGQVSVGTAGTGGTGTLRLLANERLADTVNFQLGAQGVLDLNGFNEQLEVFNSPVGSLVTNSNSATTSTLTVLEGNYAGTLANGTSTAVVALRKIGTGTLTLSGVSTHTGGVAINAGKLVANGVNVFGTGIVSVGFGTTVAELEINQNQTITELRFLSNSTSSNTVTIASGTMLNITGARALRVGIGTGTTGDPYVNNQTTNAVITGAGALNVTNTTGTFDVGIRNVEQNSDQNTALLDLRGLSGGFTADIAQFRVGYDSKSRATLYLSDTTNQIAATTVSVGNSLTNNAAVARMVLGAGVNRIYATTLDIGRGKSTGAVVDFAGATGTLELRGKGVNDRVAINVGIATEVETNAGSYGTLNLAGHEVSVNASTLTIGFRNRSGRTVSDVGARGVVSFDQGTFSVLDLIMGDRTASSVSGVPNNNQGHVEGVLNIGGGTFTVENSFSMGRNANVSTFSGVQQESRSVINLTGGLLTTNADITKGTGTNGAVGVINATINISGGMLDMKNKSIGTAANQINVTAASGGMSNVNQVNGGGAVTKTTGGTFKLEGVNTHTGATQVNEGRYYVNGTHTGAGAYTVANGARLGGTGSITAAAGQSVTVQTGGRISVGDSTAALPAASVFTVNTSGGGALTLADQSYVDFDLFGDGGQGASWVAEEADQLAINGAFNTGGTVNLTVSTALTYEQMFGNWKAGDTWRLIDWGSIVPAPSTVFNLMDQINVAALGLAWNTDNLLTQGTITLMVPEPGRALLLLIGVAGFVLRRRRGVF